MSPDEIQSLVTSLLAVSGELAVTAKSLSDSGARADAVAAKPYASTVRRIFRTHTAGLVRRYATLQCAAVPTSTVRDFEVMCESTIEETMDALDRLNAEILRR